MAKQMLWNRSSQTKSGLRITLWNLPLTKKNKSRFVVSLVKDNEDALYYCDSYYEANEKFERLLNE